jgi:hypothetical protein
MARRQQRGEGRESVRAAVGVGVWISENSHLFWTFTGEAGLLQIHYTYMTQSPSV